MYKRQAFGAHHFLVSWIKLKPGVTKNLLDLRTFVRVLLEDFLQELSCLARHMIRQWKLLLADVAVEFFVVLALKWESATKQSIEEYTKSPDISWRACVLNLAHDLWSHVWWSSTKDLDFLFVWNACWETKVDEFNSGLCLVEENVLQLDVSMSYVALMQIMNSKHNLLPQVFGLNLSHLPIRLSFKIPMQWATIHILHDQEDLLVWLKGFVKFCQTLVINLLHNLNLTLDTFATIWLKKLELLVDLNGNFLIEQLVEANSYNSVCTLADTFTNDVVINVFDCTSVCAELVLFSINGCRVITIFVILFNLICQVRIVVLGLFVSLCIIKIWALTSGSDQSSCLPGLQLTNLVLVESLIVSAKVGHCVSHWVVVCLALDGAISVDVEVLICVWRLHNDARLNCFTLRRWCTPNNLHLLRVDVFILHTLLRYFPANGIACSRGSFV